MNVFLDIIQAAIIGGFIILIVLNANFLARETWANYNSDVSIQQVLLTTAEILENDLNNIGLGLQIPQGAIQEATDTSITFKAADGLGPDAVVHTISYYTGPSSELLNTENPNDRYLYRYDPIESKNPVRVGILTMLDFDYFDNFSDLLSTPVSEDNLGLIRSIRVTMEMQSLSPSSIDQVTGRPIFGTLLWRQTKLSSRSLVR